jgi:DNA-binding NarL/FixJ family response regulator
MVVDVERAVIAWPGETPRTSPLKRAAQHSHGALASPPHFVLIDPHTLSREGLARLLSDTFAGARIDAHASAHALLADHTSSIGGATVLVAAHNGLQSVDDVLSELKARRLRDGAGPVVLLSQSWEIAAVRHALSLGVRGCISTASDLRVVAAALRLVIEGGTYIPPECLMHESAQIHAPGISACNKIDAIASFTPQQQKVLMALLDGKSNKRIARDLSLCESTVKVHVRHIMRKMDVTNRTQVAMRLMREETGSKADATQPMATKCALGPTL